MQHLISYRIEVEYCLEVSVKSPVSSSRHACDHAALRTGNTRLRARRSHTTHTRTHTQLLGSLSSAAQIPVFKLLHAFCSNPCFTLHNIMFLSSHTHTQTSGV